MEVFNHNEDPYNSAKETESDYDHFEQMPRLGSVLIGIIIAAILIAMCLFATAQHRDTLKVIHQEDLIFVYMDINSVPAKFLIDSGAQSSYLNINSLSRLKFDYLDRNFDYTGSLGGFKKRYKTYNTRNKYRFQFYAVEFGKMPIQIDGIIGGDVLHERSAVIDYGAGILSLMVK